MEDPTMDNPLDPRILRAALSMQPTTLESQIGGAGGHARTAYQVVCNKGKSDRGSVALIGEKFQGAALGATQGGGASRSQGRYAEGCQHLAVSR